MITCDMIKIAKELIADHWGAQGERVIEECAKSKPFGGKYKDFLSHCTLCGGNWGAMWLSGINELWPNVYEAIPDNMGVFAAACLVNTLILCGVDTTE